MNGILLLLLGIATVISLPRLRTSGTARSERRAKDEASLDQKKKEMGLIPYSRQELAQFRAAEREARDDLDNANELWTMRR